MRAFSHRQVPVAFSEQFKQLVEFVPTSLAALVRHVKEEWVLEALACLKGQATMRRRKLPVDRALWLAIGKSSPIPVVK
ncbi:MAG: hypothetical protein ACOX6T_27505 [Myxococcales bacterium]|jgi:hypothetical protein